MFRSVGLVTWPIMALALNFAVQASAYEKDNEHKWVAGHRSYRFPENAIIGGMNIDGSIIYVGRINITKAGILPARVSVENGTATFGFSNSLGTDEYYDVLVAEGDREYIWKRSYDGLYENGAVAVGTSIEGERRFICRRLDSTRALLIGTLELTQKRCFFWWDLNFGYAMGNSDMYEILVARPKCLN